MLVDAGGETAGGWASDVTRTWPVSGRFSPTQRDLYETVLRGQMAAIDAIKPGRRYLDLQGIAARAIGESLVALGILQGDVDELVSDGVVALFFPHGIGHLVGLDVHDLDDLGDRATYAPGRSRSTNPGLKALRLDRDDRAELLDDAGEHSDLLWGPEHPGVDPYQRFSTIRNARKWRAIGCAGIAWQPSATCVAFASKTPSW